MAGPLYSTDIDVDIWLHYSAVIWANSTGQPKLSVPPIPIGCGKMCEGGYMMMHRDELLRVDKEVCMCVFVSVCTGFMCGSERTRGRRYKYVSCKFVVTQDTSKMGDSVVPSPVTYQPLVCGSKRCASDTAVAPISKHLS